jgi:hypothetical protein
VNEKVKKLHKSFFIIWFLGALMITNAVAPYNPPAWSDGIMYPLWWILVLWGVMIASMTPVGIVVLLSFKIFEAPIATFVVMVFIWSFDYYMRIKYPMVIITLECAFSALYVFVVLKDNNHIKV